jgi:hypothetical protein
VKGRCAAGVELHAQACNFIIGGKILLQPKLYSFCVCFLVSKEKSRSTNEGADEVHVNLFDIV